MVERLLILIILAGIGYAVFRLTAHRNLRQVDRQRAVDPILLGLRPGVPAVVYFTTPNCVPCVTQQQPALAKLVAELGETVQIVQVDAAQDPDAANRWGVMTAPTTFILDRQGRPGAVNYGVAQAELLRQQLQGI